MAQESVDAVGDEFSSRTWLRLRGEITPELKHACQAGEGGVENEGRTATVGDQRWPLSPHPWRNDQEGREEQHLPDHPCAGVRLRWLG